MTVGKIYAGLLIAENWKAYKTSQSKMTNAMGMVCVEPHFCNIKFQTRWKRKNKYQYSHYM